MWLSAGLIWKPFASEPGRSCNYADTKSDELEPRPTINLFELWEEGAQLGRLSRLVETFNWLCKDSFGQTSADTFGKSNPVGVVETSQASEKERTPLFLLSCCALALLGVVLPMFPLLFFSRRRSPENVFLLKFVFLHPFSGFEFLYLLSCSALAFFGGVCLCFCLVVGFLFPKILTSIFS